MQTVPFTQHVDVFGQELTVMGRAEIDWDENGRCVGAISFSSIGINCYSTDLKQIVFTAAINVNDLPYRSVLELEGALIDQHGHEIIETMAAQVA